MRDAQVRRLPVVNDMGHLVNAISIDDLVLVAQNVRACADVASVVGFHAVGRIERRGRGRGLGSLSRFRDGINPAPAGTHFIVVLVGPQGRSTPASRESTASARFAQPLGGCCSTR